MRLQPGPGAGRTGVSLGELPAGDGAIRIVGALLPEPSQENYHPFGLAAYALTYTGYQLFENATVWENQGRLDPAPDAGVDAECADCPVEVRAGEAGAAELTITNTGAVDDSYQLGLHGMPTGWSATVEPGELQVAAGGAAAATATIEVPRSARTGTYHLTLRAESVEHDAIDEAPIEVTVRRGQPSQAGPPDHAGGGASGGSQGLGTAPVSSSRAAPTAAAALLLLVLAAVAWASTRRLARS